MRIMEKGISFGESKYMRYNAQYQDILFNGVAIGALITIDDQGLLNPMREVYQFGTDKNIPESIAQWTESEDDGWYFIQTSALGDFINAYNLINRP